jgi:hypothetical protein
MRKTIFKAISLKLELMKDGIQGGGKNTPKVFGSLIQEETEERKQADRSLSKFPINQTESQNARQRTYRDTKNQKDANPILDELATIDYDNPLPSGKAPKDLKTKADETILKAISLKLDLMKTDYSSPTDIDMKDVYEKKRVKEVEAKHNTSCPHCKQTLPKYQPDSYDE